MDLLRKNEVFGSQGDQKKRGKNLVFKEGFKKKGVSRKVSQKNGGVLIRRGF